MKQVTQKRIQKPYLLWAEDAALRTMLPWRNMAFNTRQVSAPHPHATPHPTPPKPTPSHFPALRNFFYNWKDALHHFQVVWRRSVGAAEKRTRWTPTSDRSSTDHPQIDHTDHDLDHTIDRQIARSCMIYSSSCRRVGSVYCARSTVAHVSWVRSAL